MMTPQHLQITAQDLASLIEDYGDGWNIRPSAQGRYACATRRRRGEVLWARVPPGERLECSPTLVEDSVRELREALRRETEHAQRLIELGALEPNP